jgi:hypothetical protein
MEHEAQLEVSRPTIRSGELQDTQIVREDRMVL